MNIDLERKKLELIRMEAARAELEFNILERLADVDRLKSHIELNASAQDKVRSVILDMQKLTGVNDNG